MPANTLPARTNQIAVQTAVNRGNTRCSVVLPGGTEFEFLIESVTEDGLIGRRTASRSDSAAVVFFDQIAMIEFRP